MGVHEAFQIFGHMNRGDLKLILALFCDAAMSIDMFNFLHDLVGRILRKMDRESLRSSCTSKQIYNFRGSLSSTRHLV